MDYKTKMLFKKIIIILFLEASLLSTEGVSIGIRQSVLDKLLIAMEKVIIANTLKLKLDDIQKTFLGLFACELSNFKLLNVEYTDKLKLSSINKQICVTSNRIIVKGRVSANCSITRINMSAILGIDMVFSELEVCFGLAIDDQHKLIFKTTKHGVLLKDLKIAIKSEDGTHHQNFSRVVAYLVRFLMDTINNLLQNNLEEILNKALENMVNENPLQFPIEKSSMIILDLTPLHAPIVDNGIIYSTNGYIYQAMEQFINYDISEPLKEFPKFEEGYEVTFHINDFVINNLIGAYFKNTDMFKKTFTEKDEFISLDFTVDGFSKVFQNLDKQFQPSTLKTKLQLQVTQPPHFTIRGNVISLFLTIDIDGIVILEDGSERNFGFLSVLCHLNLSMSLENISTLKIVPLSSTIIDVDHAQLYGIVVDRELVSQTINGAAQLWINYFGFSYKASLNLIHDHIVFESTKLKLENNLLVLCANISILEFPVLESSQTEGIETQNEDDPLNQNNSQRRTNYLYSSGPARLDEKLDGPIKVQKNKSLGAQKIKI